MIASASSNVGNRDGPRASAERASPRYRHPPKGAEDAAQTSPNGYRYDAWGGIESESGTLDNPYGYTARERQNGSRSYLLHYRTRVCDPAVPRFLSKDPAGMVDGPNLYAYAGNNPVNSIDPSGVCHNRGRASDRQQCPPTTTPAVGPGSSICTARWIYLGVAFAVAIASLILGYAAMTVATQSLPFLVATSGIGVTGQLAVFVTAAISGDTGRMLRVLGVVFGYILALALASAGFWTMLGIMGRIVTIWTLILQLIIAAAFIGLAIWGLQEAKCI